MGKDDIILGNEENKLGSICVGNGTETWNLTFQGS